MAEQAAPTLEQVCSMMGLMESHDPEQVELAQSWINDFKGSVWAWSLTDTILANQVSISICTIAAQIIRHKIEDSFRELPESSLVPLRDSLLNHLDNYASAGVAVILRQLCLALADLAVYMESWSHPCQTLLHRFGTDDKHMLAMLEFIRVMPEEISNRRLKITPQRQAQVDAELMETSQQVYTYLAHALAQGSLPQEGHLTILKALASWLQLGGLGAELFFSTSLFDFAFSHLTELESQEDAADVLAAAIVYASDPSTLHHLSKLVEHIGGWQSHLDKCITEEDSDTGRVLVRLFTDLAVAYASEMVYQPNELTVGLLQSITTCLGHPDADVVAVTYHFWYCLADYLSEVQSLEALPLLAQIQGAYGQLYERLYHATILPSDFEGMLDVNSTDGDIRYNAAELLIETSFVLTAPTIGQQLLNLATAGESWQSKEAALFLFRAVVGKLGYRYSKQESKVNTPFIQQGEVIVQDLLPMLTSVTTDAAVQLRRTCVHLLGSASKFYCDLSDWLGKHPDYIPSAFRFLCQMIRCPELKSGSAIAIMHLASKGRAHCGPHLPDILEIIKAHQALGLVQRDVLDIVKGASRVIAALHGEACEQAARQLLGVYMPQLQQMTVERPADLQQLEEVLEITAHIFRQHYKEDGSHPLAAVGLEVCQTVLGVIQQYTTASTVVERCNQTIQWCVRCLGQDCVELAANILSVLTAVYEATKDPSCLYVATAMVGVFGLQPTFQDPLFNLVDGLSRSTFQLLASSPDALRHNPDSVSDIFRLLRKVLEAMPLRYLSSELPAISLDCAVHCITVQERETNEEVATYLSNLFRSASAGISDEFTIHQDTIAQHVSALMQSKGEGIVHEIMSAITGSLPTYMLPDSAEVLWYLMAINREAVVQWAFSAPAAANINERNISDRDKQDFALNLTECTDRRAFVDACRHFGRLFG